MRNVQVLILKDKEFLWANFTLGTVETLETLDDYKGFSQVLKSASFHQNYIFRSFYKFLHALK